MKKILFALLLSALLVGCSSEKTNENSQDTEKETKVVVKPSEGTQDEEQNKTESESEISKFVKNYNDLASLSDDLESLDDSKEVDDSGAQVLYASNDYGIIAIYENDTLEKYSFVFSKDEPYEELKGTALNALLHVAATINLNTDELIKEFEESLSKEFYSYFAEDYIIVFINQKLSGQSDFGMVVEFAKK